MKIFWYSNASIIIQSGDKSIAFDPFCSITPGDLKKNGKKLPFEKELSGADDVFVTHGHFDHIYHIPRLYAAGNARIFCTKTPAEKLKRKGIAKNRVSEIAPEMTIKSGPFTVLTRRGKHCKFDMSLLYKTIFSLRFFRHPLHLLRLLWIHMTYHENGEILFYEVRCEGRRIQILGSMNLDNSEDYPTGADLLILPLQGRSDQDTYALKIVDRLMPKAVLLDHYDNAFEPLTNSVDVSGFIENVTKFYHIPCFTLKPGESYTI